MLNQIAIKRSPIVPIQSFLLIEIVGFFLFLIATQLDTLKFQLYSSLPLPHSISYETAKLFFLSVAQFIITIYAFMRWYYESYSVRSGFLSHQWGVFFRKNKSIPLNKAMTVTISSNPFGKWLHYGSIHIESGPSNKTITIADISRPIEFMKVIERSINPENNHFQVEPNLNKLLSLEEHERLEFKSSLRFDHKNGQTNREMEKAVMKTIAAFLNTKGGHLIIGVNDKKEPIGLEKDYQTLRRPDSDGFENHFTLVFNTMIGPEFRQLVKVWFNLFGNNDICIIQVVPSPRPVYLKLDDNEHFYVRTGNVTTPLKLSEIEAYRRSRWPQRITTN